MGWAKGKSRGFKCKVCGKYFLPHGVGPHMTVHLREASRRIEEAVKPEAVPDLVTQLLGKAEALRAQAAEIEAAVSTLCRLGEVHGK